MCAGPRLSETPTVRGVQSLSSETQPRCERKFEKMRVSTPSPLQTAGAARERLRAYRKMCDARDGLIIAAKDAGLSEVEIAQLSGHSRNTVRSILAKHGENAG